MKFFRSLCLIQTTSRPVNYTRGWVQIAEQEILTVVASLVHCCAIRMNVMPHSHASLPMYSSQQGCQIGFFEPKFWNSGFFEHLWFFWKKKPKKNQTKSGSFQWERLGSGKTMSELHIHYRSLLKRVYDHAGCKEYWKYFNKTVFVKKATWTVGSSPVCSQYTSGWICPWAPPKKILDPPMNCV